MECTRVSMSFMRMGWDMIMNDNPPLGAMLLFKELDNLQR